ncbi:MAG: acyl-CoA dehydratase activase-related protein, partial [Dehalococcoidales bacterium]|nr:acyl-CoA dehydratase activase-related protein [Dehalococcoidales bacterium]
LSFETRAPLQQFEGQVKRMEGGGFTRPLAGMSLLLGVDAGSTTTKAILFDCKNREPVAGCYLRTHGNPVQATSQCLAELKKQLDEAGVADDSCRVIQAAVTGSGRDLVSVYLDNCLSFNEILAHARAAREAAADVDTLFEIGGQDAKFVALQSGIPVDYSMNDGCSAGTGSFLEEAASSDMQVAIDEIGIQALNAQKPIAFGERCAAFINSEVRSALQQGAPRSDVLAGLVYSITDNYLSRVVGARNIGNVILLQGGVALNPALATAMAARTGRDIRVPPHPELAGCVGSALMALDLLGRGLAEELDRRLDSFGNMQMEIRKIIRCQGCDNHCEIKQIALNDKIYPFGGLCAKWEMLRRPRSLRHKEGPDMVSLRYEMMFRTFAPVKPEDPRGRIGLPLALSTYELYPFYARLLSELGYEVVLSRPGQGERRTYAPTCYPGEILHAAVDDLFKQGVDYIFLPYLREFSIPGGHEHAYSCSEVQDVPGVIKTIFEKEVDRLLTPEIGLSDHLLAATEKEILLMSEKLGISKTRARKALTAALEYQEKFEITYREAVEAGLKELEGPVVVLVGRPYAAFSPEVNLSIPRKITSRGFNVVPADGLPFMPSPNERDVWHFTQLTRSAVNYARQHEEYYVCALSCFSCSPDAIAFHRLRHDLEGAPYCFLEIDSHTAHAGIETRIGAFLDIIEERRRRTLTGSISMQSPAKQARLEASGGKVHIVDSSGERFGLDDRRVLHVLLADLPYITSQMFANLYGTLGWKSMTTPDMTFETLQKARRVCSGRECLPFLAMMGKVIHHLETRPDGEFTVFHLLDQEGPCQNGNWHDALPMVVERLGKSDAVGAWPTLKNNYLGGGDRAALIMVAACIAGDLLSEAHSSLRCLAVDQKAAMSLYDELENELLEAGKSGLLATEKQLRTISRRLAEVPLRASPMQWPRVLLFGGINRIFVDEPVRDFFENRGILAKTNDISEFISLLEFEWIKRSGFAHGHIYPEGHYSVITILGDLMRPVVRDSTRRAMRARMHCQVMEMLEKRWRGIMAESGLLFTPHVPFKKLAQQGHRKVSCNSQTEATYTLGRYFSALNTGTFDGYVNIGAFNCVPSNTASAVINVMSKHIDIPYAMVEADGTALTASQVRQLETVAAQCLRNRNIK